MNIFKVGDKVRFTGTGNDFKGGEGIVTNVGLHLVDYKVTKLPDSPSAMFPHEIGKTIRDTCGGGGISPRYLTKLVEEKPTFKVGDKVELLMDYMWAKKGDVLTVIDPNRYGNPYLEHDATGKEMGGLAWRFKPVESPKFKVDDKVKFIGTVSGFTGETVTIIATDNSSTYPLRVKRADGQECPVVEKELEHITEPEAEEVKRFTFKDIQKGDKIRRTRTYKSGAVEIREGVATNPATDGYWSDGRSFILAYDTDDTKDGLTLELLERPEPVKTREELLVDGAKIGTKILISTKSDVRKVYTKDAENSWSTLVIKPYGVHKGFNWNDASMKVNLKGHDAKLVKS